VLVNIRRCKLLTSPSTPQQCISPITSSKGLVCPSDFTNVQGNHLQISTRHLPMLHRQQQRKWSEHTDSKSRLTSSSPHSAKSPSLFSLVAALLFKQSVVKKIRGRGDNEDDSPFELANFPPIQHVKMARHPKLSLLSNLSGRSSSHYVDPRVSAVG